MFFSISDTVLFSWSGHNGLHKNKVLRCGGLRPAGECLGGCGACESWISVGARYCRDQRKTFLSVELFGVESAAGLVAFIGFSGNKIEMLFVASAYQGSGIGSRLIAFAKERGMRFVDVNEQNPDALDFYKKHGFKLVSRDECDDAGRPFPILHLMSDE